MPPKPTSRFGWKNVTELSMFVNTLSFVFLDPATPSKNHFSMIKARLMLVHYQIAKFSADKKSLIFNVADALSADAVSPC